MKNISQYIMYVLIVVGVGTFLMSITSDDMNPSHDAIIYYSYILFGVCTAVALLASVANMITNPGNIAKSAIGFVGLAIVLGVSYGMADGAVEAQFVEEIGETTSKLAGASLYAVYILSFLAVGSIVFSAVSKIAK